MRFLDVHGSVKFIYICFIYIYTILLYIYICKYKDEGYESVSSTLCVHIVIVLCVYLVYLYPFYVIKQKVALFLSFPFPYHRTSTAAECMHMLWNSHQVFVQFVYFFPTSIDYR